jgi:hypothetical protein
MMGPEPSFHWPRWIGEALTLAGGLFAMAIVGVLSAASVVWSRLVRREAPVHPRAGSRPRRDVRVSGRKTTAR